MWIVGGCSGRRTLGSGNRIPWSFLLLLSTGCALWSAVALAGDTLRCGSYLVSVGDPGYEVEARCGQPSYRYFTADGDIWIYNFGPSRFLEQLRFLNGRLVDISSHGYGFSAPSHGQSPANHTPPPYDDFSPYPYEAPLYPLYAPLRHAQRRDQRRKHRERMWGERREPQHRKQGEKGQKRTGERHEWRRLEPENERKGASESTVP